jgi:hypothetical protein
VVTLSGFRQERFPMGGPTLFQCRKECAAAIPGTWVPFRKRGRRLARRTQA